FPPYAQSTPVVWRGPPRRVTLDRGVRGDDDAREKFSGRAVRAGGARRGAAGRLPEPAGRRGGGPSRRAAHGDVLAGAGPHVRVRGGVPRGRRVQLLRA